MSKLEYGAVWKSSIDFNTLFISVLTSPVKSLSGNPSSWSGSHCVIKKIESKVLVDAAPQQLRGNQQRFTLFAELPVEIRLIIWKMNILRNYVVLTDAPKLPMTTYLERPTTRVPMVRVICSRSNIPANLHVCWESRLETIKEYWLLFRRPEKIHSWACRLRQAICHLRACRSCCPATIFSNPVYINVRGRDQLRIDSGEADIVFYLYTFGTEIPFKYISGRVTKVGGFDVRQLERYNEEMRGFREVLQDWSALALSDIWFPHYIWDRQECLIDCKVSLSLQMKNLKSVVVTIHVSWMKLDWEDVSIGMHNRLYKKWMERMGILVRENGVSGDVRFPLVLVHLYEGDKVGKVLRFLLWESQQFGSALPRVSRQDWSNRETGKTSAPASEYYDWHTVPKIDIWSFGAKQPLPSA